jgi:hypothetical protein
MTDPSSRQRERPTSTNLQPSDSNKDLIVSPKWILYSMTDWPNNTSIVAYVFIVEGTCLTSHCLTLNVYWLRYSVLKASYHNIIVPSTSGSFLWSLSFWFYHQNPICILLSNECYMPLLSNLPWFHHFNNMWQGIKLLSCIWCISLRLP